MDIKGPPQIHSQKRHTDVEHKTIKTRKLNLL